MSEGAIERPYAALQDAALLRFLTLPGASLHKLAVYHVINRRRWTKQPNPSKAAMARMLGIHRQRVVESIDWLTEHGLIETDDAGRWKAVRLPGEDLSDDTIDRTTVRPAGQTVRSTGHSVRPAGRPVQRTPSVRSAGQPPSGLPDTAPYIETRDKETNPQPPLPGAISEHVSEVVEPKASAKVFTDDRGHDWPHPDTVTTKTVPESWRAIWELWGEAHNALTAVKRGSWAPAYRALYGRMAEGKLTATDAFKASRAYLAAFRHPSEKQWPAPQSKNCSTFWSKKGRHWEDWLPSAEAVAERETPQEQRPWSDLTADQRFRLMYPISCEHEVYDVPDCAPHWSAADEDTRRRWVQEARNR